jgi:hypothetical protein
MPDLRPQAISSRLATALMAALLVIGLYMPTSFGTAISVKLYLVTAAALLSTLAALLLRRRGILSMVSVVNAAAINVILLVCTLFTPFVKVAYGGYIPILLASALFCVSMRDVSLTTGVRRLFDAANIANIILGTLLVLQAPAVVQFFFDNYSYGYDDLLPYMLAEGKPVLTFGSHSLAGFFYYLLFYLTFQTFVTTSSKLNLIFAACYLALLTCLYSFTSLVFAGLATAQIIAHFQWRKSALAGLLVTVLLGAAVVFVPQLDAVAGFKEDLVGVINREDNGLLGRYSATGGLSANLDYIAEHPLQPMGLGLSDDLWYSDSGVVEYMLRGSFPLVFTVYAGAFLFFRKNLKSSRRAVFLFLVFLGFELGYPNLEYIRTQCFLPFVVVYLNGLDGWSPEAGWKYA